MNSDYLYYKKNDYLADDFFVRSMLFPTKETLLFWDELIDHKKIEVDEYIDAYMVVKTWERNKPEIPAYRLDGLWERIDTTRNLPEQKNKKRKYRISYIYYIAAACCAALIIGSFFFLKQTKEETKPGKFDYSQYQVINKEQAQNEIVIITDDNQMKVIGENPEVSYNPNGALAVNNKNIKKEESAPGSSSRPVLNQLCVPFGKRAQLKLSDGSKLWINTGTTVIYPTVFPGDKREIYVAGEIYAEVMPDAGKPFIVKTGNMEISVRGTEFNLSAYKEETMEQVVLVTGSVEVKQNGDNGRIKEKMKPNQAYTYITGQGSSLETVNTEIYTSWRKGIYIFENESIENILLKLARYYNVTMVIPKQASGIVCYGKLELKEDFSKLLTGLMEIASFNFSLKENQYIIQFR